MNPELTAAAEKAAYERGRREGMTGLASFLRGLADDIARGPLMADYLQAKHYREVADIIENKRSA